MKSVRLYSEYGNWTHASAQKKRIGLDSNQASLASVSYHHSKWLRIPTTNVGFSCSRARVHTGYFTGRLTAFEIMQDSLQPISVTTKVLILIFNPLKFRFAELPAYSNHILRFTSHRWEDQTTAHSRRNMYLKIFPFSSFFSYLSNLTLFTP